jgi:hypothetical protein
MGCSSDKKGKRGRKNWKEKKKETPCDFIFHLGSSAADSRLCHISPPRVPHIIV